MQSGDPGYIAGQIHGLIATTINQSTGISWYNGNNTFPTITGTAIGAGLANTNAIITSQGIGGYAAKLCYDLVFGGYNDWYLPSKNELNKLYLNKIEIGGFASSLYWSSSEGGTYYAWNQLFGNGFQDWVYKYNQYYVRAVRAF